MHDVYSTAVEESRQRTAFMPPELMSVVCGMSLREVLGGANVDNRSFGRLGPSWVRILIFSFSGSM
jgi:hypothetical protein